MKEFLLKAWLSLCGMAMVAVAPDAVSMAQQEVVQTSTCHEPHPTGDDNLDAPGRTAGAVGPGILLNGTGRQR